MNERTTGDTAYSLQADQDDSSPPKSAPFEDIDGIHPLGWVAGAIALVALLLHLTDTKYLIGNFAWWHWAGLVITALVSLRPIILHRLRLSLELIPALTGSLAWMLGWFVFLVQLINVITRYGNDLVERDILIGQTTSLAWQSFGLIFILGMNNGVKTCVNPRIDFWWAEFSSTRKAWLDFVLHLALLLPFTVMSIRILKPYAAKSLGQNRDGTWDNGLQVWNTWELSADADQLPIGPIKALIAVAFILFGIQIFAEVIKTGFVIMGRDDLGDAHQRDHGSPLRVE